MIHSLLLVVLGFFGAMNGAGSRNFFFNDSLLVLSILLFSGSIYVWVFSCGHWLRKLTQVGGVGFVLSWLLLAFQVRVSNKE